MQVVKLLNMFNTIFIHSKTIIKNTMEILIMNSLTQILITKHCTTDVQQIMHPR